MKKVISKKKFEKTTQKTDTSYFFVYKFEYLEKDFIQRSVLLYGTEKYGVLIFV